MQAGVGWYRLSVITFWQAGAITPTEKRIYIGYIFVIKMYNV